jgi:hypothetical protein
MDHDVVRLMLRSFTVIDPHIVNLIREKSQVHQNDARGNSRKVRERAHDGKRSKVCE